MDNQISRRSFVIGGLSSLAFAGLPGLKFLNNSRSTSAEPDKPIIVLVSIRGGWDALNVVVPNNGVDADIYQKARPGIKIPLKKLISLDDRFGLHPALAKLDDLYRDGKLAIIHAAGLTSNTRSHFDAVQYIEFGTPGQKLIHTGWMTRAWHALELKEEGLPLISIPTRPTALVGLNNVISLSNPGDLTRWDNGYLAEQNQVLARLYAGDGALRESVRHTLEVMAAGSVLAEEYRPANKAKYESDEFNNSMQTIAQIVKSQMGLRFATVDFGGWDTHQWQNNGENGQLSDLLYSLGSGLSAFFHDLGDEFGKQVTVLVMSEFGRRLTQNESGGTDHGHGGVMFVLGAGVKGGQVFGSWPGLEAEQLYDWADLQVTTDYRAVVSNILKTRLGIETDGIVFPNYQSPPSLGFI